MLEQVQCWIPDCYMIICFISWVCAQTVRCTPPPHLPRLICAVHRHVYFSSGFSSPTTLMPTDAAWKLKTNLSFPVTENSSSKTKISMPSVDLLMRDKSKFGRSQIITQAEKKERNSASVHEHMPTSRHLLQVEKLSDTELAADRAPRPTSTLVLITSLTELMRRRCPPLWSSLVSSDVTVLMSSASAVHSASSPKGKPPHLTFFLQTQALMKNRLVLFWPRLKRGVLRQRSHICLKTWGEGRRLPADFLPERSGNDGDFTFTGS